MNTSTLPAFRYSYEEFADHIRAMSTVRQWEYTSRFGHVGTAQTNRARSERVLEYFADTYNDQKEAVYKAELFLSIHDYIGRNQQLFCRKGLVEELDGSVFLVEPNLLRAVHHAFSVSANAGTVAPKKVLALAKAFKSLEEPS